MLSAVLYTALGLLLGFFVGWAVARRRERGSVRKIEFRESLPSVLSRRPKLFAKEYVALGALVQTDGVYFWLASAAAPGTLLGPAVRAYSPGDAWEWPERPEDRIRAEAVRKWGPGSLAEAEIAARLAHSEQPMYCVRVAKPVGDCSSVGQELPKQSTEQAINQTLQALAVELQAVRTCFMGVYGSRLRYEPEAVAVAPKGSQLGDWRDGLEHLDKALSQLRSNGEGDASGAIGQEQGPGCTGSSSGQLSVAESGQEPPNCSTDASKPRETAKPGEEIDSLQSPLVAALDGGPCAIPATSEFSPAWVHMPAVDLAGPEGQHIRIPGVSVGILSREEFESRRHSYVEVQPLNGVPAGQNQEQLPTPAKPCIVCGHPDMPAHAEAHRRHCGDSCPCAGQHVGGNGIFSSAFTLRFWDNRHRDKLSRAGWLRPAAWLLPLVALLSACTSSPEPNSWPTVAGIVGSLLAVAVWLHQRIENIAAQSFSEYQRLSRRIDHVERMLDARIDSLCDEVHQADASSNEGTEDTGSAGAKL